MSIHLVAVVVLLVSLWIPAPKIKKLWIVLWWITVCLLWGAGYIHGFTGQLWSSIADVILLSFATAILVRVTYNQVRTVPG